MVDVGVQSSAYSSPASPASQSSENEDKTSVASSYGFSWLYESDGLPQSGKLTLPQFQS